MQSDEWEGRLTSKEYSWATHGPIRRNHRTALEILPNTSLKSPTSGSNLLERTLAPSKGVHVSRFDLLNQTEIRNIQLNNLQPSEVQVSCNLTLKL